jgi:hypothetical protein
MIDHADKQAFKRGRIARKIWRWIQTRAQRELRKRELQFEIQSENGLNYVRPRIQA